MNCLSFKTKFGWISAFEKKNKIVILKFGKHKNKSISKNLKKLRSNIFNFLNKKNKKIDTKLHINGNLIQKKIWRELIKIKFETLIKYFNRQPLYNILGTSVRDRDNREKIHFNKKRERMHNYSIIPSPYLEGTFEDLFKKYNYKHVSIILLI